MKRPKHQGDFENYVSNTVYHKEINEYCDCLEAELVPAKLKVINDKLEILEAYSFFLQEHGYMDGDWWMEDPKAIDEFTKTLGI